MTVYPIPRIKPAGIITTKRIMRVARAKIIPTGNASIIKTKTIQGNFTLYTLK